MPKRTNLIYKYWAWPVGYIFFIIFLSSLNLHSIKKINLNHLDKILHIVEYTIFGYLLTRAYRATTSLSYRKVFFVIFLAGFLVGSLDEYYQSFLIYRQSSFMDVVADVIGVVIGMVLFRKLRR